MTIRKLIFITTAPLAALGLTACADNYAVEGAAAGAAVGAAVGAVTDEDDIVENAAIGAAVGAVAGYFIDDDDDCDGYDDDGELDDDCRGLPGYPD